jgi:hypothetical protein
MTDKTPEAGRTTPATGAVGSLVDQGVVRHTPGPWEVFRETYADGGTRIMVRTAAEGWCANICRGTTVMEGSRLRWADEDMSEETRAFHAADAQLIAAAPDLLRVLTTMRDALRAAGYATQAADAVIEQATGSETVTPNCVIEQTAICRPIAD